MASKQQLLKYIKTQNNLLEKLLLELNELDYQQNKINDYKIKEVNNNRIYYFGKENDEFLISQGIKGLNPPQKKFFDALNEYDENGMHKYFIYLFTGGNQVGKTTIIIVIAICFMAGEWLWLDDNDPRKKIKFNHNNPRKIVLIGHSWDQMKLDIENKLDTWWPKKRKVFTSKNNSGIKCYWKDIKTGSELILLSNKQDEMDQEGISEVDMMICNEPIRRPVYLANKRGLLARDGLTLFSMTLLEEPWIEDELINRLDENGEPDMSVWTLEAAQEENVGYGLTMEAVKRFQKGLTPEEKYARAQGKPLYHGLKIYPDFNRQTHIKELKYIPSDWLFIPAIDFHPTKPWAIQFNAIDENNIIYVVDEIVMIGSWKDVCDEIHQFIENNQFRIHCILMEVLSKGTINSDLEHESVFTKMQNRFYDYGYDLKEGSKQLNTGINVVNSKLMPITGIPALYINKKCTVTEKHLRSYMKNPETGLPIAKNNEMCENLYRSVLEFENVKWYPPVNKTIVFNNIVRNIQTESIY